MTTTASATATAAARPRDRVAVAVLLVGTAVLYLWDLTVDGTANAFYAASAWAGSRSWEALLFGSLDPSNFITVDKPPVSQWVMGLSARLFGFSSASVLVPEALMGVATVALVHGAVTRLAGRGAGLAAGTAMALTPVAVMMFRFDNPDAAMVLLMTAGAYATVRAVTSEHRGAARRWLALAGVAVGLAFLAKMLEGLMVVPALGLAYLLAGRAPLRRRLADLLLAVAAMVVSAGWYVVLTILWPASSRPYLAGSTDNSFMNLVLGYNGLQRLQGRGGGAPGGAPGARSLDPAVARELAERFAHSGYQPAGGPGLTRLLTGESGVETSWLVPAALVALLVGLVLRGRAPRTDPARAGLVLFGAWLLVDGGVLSFMKSYTHAYYSMAVAPPVAALVGLGAALCWRERHRLVAVVGGAATVAAAGGWSLVVVRRDPTWQPWLGPVVAGLTGLAVVGVLVLGVAGVRRARAEATTEPAAAERRTATGRLAAAVVAVAAVAALAAPAAYSAEVVATPHTGGSPSADPLAEQRSQTPRDTGGYAALLDGGTGATATSLTRLLQGTRTRWAAAVSQSSAAADLELSTRTPVMAIGGFTGSDPAPTLAQFQADVAAGQVGYYVVVDRGGRSQDGSRGDSGGPSRGYRGGFFARGGVTTQIEQWVQAHYRAQQVGGDTVYDLQVTGPARSV